MIKRRLLLLSSGVGVVTMLFGQYMARPQYYGTEFGRAWAHVFWLGFLLFIVPVAALVVRYIAKHKNPLIKNAGKYQVFGIASITGAIGFLTVTAVLLGNQDLTGYDGDARRGVFVLWLLLIVMFTIANVSTLIIRLLKRKK